MIFAISLAFTMVATTFLLHYRTLLWLGQHAQGFGLEQQTQVLLIVATLFCVHIVEIGIYAFTYEISVTYLDLGVFQGSLVNDAMSYLYYSGVIYTTLGLGDIEPQGHIRFITAMEALNGILLITWSASFTFLAMGRLWPWDAKCGQSLENEDSNDVIEIGR